MKTHLIVRPVLTRACLLSGLTLASITLNAKPTVPADGLFWQRPLL